jgi:Zn-dependent M28 family amino/carboxypeptidase
MFRPPAYDPRTAALVGRVSTAALAANILTLQNFQTRYASYPGCEQAGDYLYAYFLALGLPTEFDPFTFSSNRSSRNVIAMLPGKASPEYVVILCAHYDSTTGSTTGPTTAPGADDNASGTAAVMEIARLLAGRSFDFTIKFICFSAEEWGLYGSKHYAQEARNAGEKILGVLNMDMIAYADALPKDLDLFVNPASEWLANWFVLCARQYVAIDLARSVDPSMRASDHSPFWDQGFSALLAIEDYSVRNPYYHKTTDLITTLNLDFATAVTKIVLAVASGLAQPGLQ